MTSQEAIQDKPKQKSRLHITSAQNDARYVALGRTLFLTQSPDAQKELKKANKKKNGHPYVYPESTILSLATIRCFCGLSFRVIQGLAIAALGEDDAPGYRQIHRRMKSIKVSIKDNIITARGKKSTLNMSIDGSGMSPNARSEYIRYRHKTKHGFIRLVLVVDTDTREILSFSITDDTVGEAPQFEDLTCAALENVGMGALDVQDKKPVQQSALQEADTNTRQKQSQTKVHANDKQESPQSPSADNELLGQLNVIMRADGGFDSRKIFEVCKKLGITPYIRIKHNATTRSRGVSRDRTMAVLDQLGNGITDPDKFAQLTKDERESNRKEWKKRVNYGKRWLVEIVISSFKRLFGDSVSAVTWENITQEINLKVNIYNKMLQVQRRAIAMA